MQQPISNDVFYKLNKKKKQFVNPYKQEHTAVVNNQRRKLNEMLTKEIHRKSKNVNKS